MDFQTMHQNVKLELDKTSALELPAFEPEEIDYWLTNATWKFGKTRYDGLNVKGTGFEQTQKRIDDLRTLIKSYTDTSPAASTTYVATGGYNSGLPVLGSGTGDEDYWFTLTEDVNIVVSTVETRVGITECTIDELRFRLDDPYSEHILHYGSAKPLRIFKGNSVELIGDGANYTIDDYHLTYLKRPQKMSRTDVASGSIVAGTVYGVYSASPAAYVTYNGNNYYTGDVFTGVTAVTTYTESGTCTVNTSCDLPEHTHDEIVKMAASMMLENIEQPRYQTHMNEVNTME